MDKEHPSFHLPAGSQGTLFPDMILLARFLNADFLGVDLFLGTMGALCSVSTFSMSIRPFSLRRKVLECRNFVSFIFVSPTARAQGQKIFDKATGLWMAESPKECQRLRGPSGHRRHVGPWELVYWDCLPMGPSHRAPPPGSAGSLCRRAFSHSSTRVKCPQPPRPERSLNPTLSPWLAVIEQW